MENLAVVVVTTTVHTALAAGACVKAVVNPAFVRSYFIIDSIVSGGNGNASDSGSGNISKVSCSTGKNIVKSFKCLHPEASLSSQSLAQSQSQSQSTNPSSSCANAAFLLEYCLQDIPNAAPYTNLIGLPLIPLENGTLAQFGGPLESEPLFIVTALERKLPTNSVLTQYWLPTNSVLTQYWLPTNSVLTQY